MDKERSNPSYTLGFPVDVSSISNHSARCYSCNITNLIYCKNAKVIQILLFWSTRRFRNRMNCGARRQGEKREEETLVKRRYFCIINIHWSPSAIVPQCNTFLVYFNWIVCKRKKCVFVFFVVFFSFAFYVLIIYLNDSLKIDPAKLSSSTWRLSNEWVSIFAMFTTFPIHKHTQTPTFMPFTRFVYIKSVIFEAIYMYIYS